MYKNLLKTFLVVALCSLPITAFAPAEPSWKEKPVQCGDIKEIYNRYVINYNMIPMFTGVANSKDIGLNNMAVPVVFFMDDQGRWMLVEINVTDDGAGPLSCIISLGSGFDSNIDHDELIMGLLGASSL